MTLRLILRHFEKNNLQLVNLEWERGEMRGFIWSKEKAGEA